MSTEELTLAVDVKLEFLDADGNIAGGEHTVTDLIMRNGARVLTSSNVPIGDSVVIKTTDGRFESAAIIKDIQIGSDRIPRLILEFTGSAWQRQWLFPNDEERPELYYGDLMHHTRETCMLLQIIIADLEVGQAPDQVFLSELKANIDDLRSTLFRIQKAFCK